MEESILTSIKKLLGLGEDYTAFDADIIFDINSALAMLSQIGIGPENGFNISGKDEIWEDFIGGAEPLLADVISYVHLTVRFLFDTPQSSSVCDVYTALRNECAWRIEVAKYTIDNAEDSE